MILVVSVTINGNVGHTKAIPFISMDEYGWYMVVVQESRLKFSSNDVIWSDVDGRWKILIK